MKTYGVSFSKNVFELKPLSYVSPSRERQKAKIEVNLEMYDLEANISKIVDDNFWELF